MAISPVVFILAGLLDSTAFIDQPRKPFFCPVQRKISVDTYTTFKKPMPLYQPRCASVQRSASNRMHQLKSNKR